MVYPSDTKGIYDMARVYFSHMYNFRGFWAHHVMHVTPAFLIADSRLRLQFVVGGKATHGFCDLYYEGNSAGWDCVNKQLYSKCTILLRHI